MPDRMYFVRQSSSTAHSPGATRRIPVEDAGLMEGGVACGQVIRGNRLCVGLQWDREASKQAMSKGRDLWMPASRKLHNDVYKSLVILLR